MKISGFTFLRNAEKLGYPYLESIASIIDFVDEFVIALGPSDEDDNTEKTVYNLAKNNPKIRIIPTTWQEQQRVSGFVYAQQKAIAYYNTTGDWAFYLEADEVVHENDLNLIYEYMKKYKENPKVEALAFLYKHFYGNANTYIDSSAWYRKEVRIIKTNIRAFPPDGLFFVVFVPGRNTKVRYPYAVTMPATIYHYGWVRPVSYMQVKENTISKYWGSLPKKIDYREIDSTILKLFNGSHPKAILPWLEKYNLLEGGIFKANPYHKLTKRERKHRIIRVIEKIFKLDLAKHFYKEVE